MGVDEGHASITRDPAPFQIWMKMAAENGSTARVARRPELLVGHARGDQHEVTRRHLPPA